MTRQEHGHVSKLTSILLLGFLLPHSTGNEFFLLQDLSSNKSNRSSSSALQTAGAQTSEESIQDYILNMSLEERLESTLHKFPPNEFGEFNSVVHEQLDLVFRSFLTNALGPFLSGRPAHTQIVDLIHVLAMAIHPQPSDQPIGQTADELEQLESTEWNAAKLLMMNPIAHNFQINYSHRLLIVRIVSDCLMVPEYNKIKSSNDAPLFEGALPHLRASLYAFGMAAMSPYDSHWAQCGLVSIAVQSGIDYVIKEEWGRLLHRLVDDQTKYYLQQNKGTKKQRNNNTEATVTNTTMETRVWLGGLQEVTIDRQTQNNNNNNGNSKRGKEEGPFRWSDGSTPFFGIWAEGQPDNVIQETARGPSGEHRVLLNENGEMEDGHGGGILALQLPAILLLPIDYDTAYPSCKMLC